MVKSIKVQPVKALPGDYLEALVNCGLVDDIADPEGLQPEPYRYAEGEVICQHGQPVTCLWIIVNGSVAVREGNRNLFVRRRNEVIGEQHLVGNGYQRIYDLVADKSSVEVLKIGREKIEAHPEAYILWRNIARILSIKLRNASRKTSSLSRQLADDTRILHAYTNEYALSRRLLSGGEHQAEYAVDRAIIWFSDIVDFSRHTLGTSPDRIADIVQRFFNAQSHPILKSGGHIDKFIGDGLMAFWVLPEKANDISIECFAALRAADDAIAAVQSIRIGSEPLALRIGLHTGMVLSGDFGSTTRHQFTLIGEEVNKAGRLEQVRAEDLVGKPSDLGDLRVSEEFHDGLSPVARRRFRAPLVARCKNIGEIRFYTK